MAVEGGTTSVQVALRIKPLTEEDLEKLPSRFQRQVITNPSPNQIIVEGEKRQIFHFDHVFPPETTQHEVYYSAVENLVAKFLEGYNVTILAYGQTSSGKTYTMGTADNSSMPYHAKGIIPRAMETLFNTMNTSIYSNRKFSMKVSFIEIYNEDLIDLLGEGEGESRPQVMIREDSKGNIYWSGLQEATVNNVDEVMAYLARGSLNRQVGATDMNSKSSRSHAIFSITMSQQKLVTHNGTNGYHHHSKSPTPGSRPTTPSSKFVGSRANSRLDVDDGDWITISSKFHFVDLAGSERLKRTAASGDRAKEGISINSGLLALGNVISALGDPTKVRHTTHIPYRDSKLTRLLQDSLGGNAQTLMIACVSPAEFNLNETVNTLKYANRARNIKNLAAINQEETGWNDIGHLQNLVVKLRSEITNLKVTISNSNNSNHSNHSNSNGTTSGRTTPVDRIKSPTAGFYSSIPGRTTPTTTGIPGRTTPTTGRITPSGRVTPSGIPGPTGRNTPTSSGIPGPSGIPGRSTPTSGVPGPSGRNTPNSVIPSGKSTVTRRPSRPSRPSSPLTTFSQSAYYNNKDMESMEDQLLQLQHSYAELSRNHAKTLAELAMHQDNNHDKVSDKNFMKLAEPIIEEYEKTISTLESKLAIVDAALSHAENVLKEKEDKVDSLEKHQEQTKSLNTNLQKYIKELELKLEKREFDTKLGVVREERPEKFVSETVKILEEKLNERENAFKELEERLKQTNVDQDKQELLGIINSRDKRISFLDTKLNQLGVEVDKLRELEGTTSNNNNSSENINNSLSLEEKLLKTEIELNETKSKYEKSLSQIHELQSRYDNDSTPITPMSPITPATPHNNEYNFKESSDIDVSLKVHRKAKSLSTDLKSEKRNLAHAAIVEKLQFELKLFESFHKDKQQSLDAVRHELELLEKDYRETLQLVDELQEELKKRDDNTNSEIIEPENNVGLLQEVEQLKVKQKQLLQNITEYEIENNNKVKEIEKLESNIRDLHKQMVTETSTSENEEILVLRERVAKLQAETVSNKDHENIITRLENELQEAHKLASQDKNLVTSRDVTKNDENVIALEDTVRNLENELKKAKENVDHKDNVIKQELENKGLLQKNLKDRETELAILTKQLMDLRKQDEDAQRRIKELQVKLSNAETIKEMNESLESDLGHIRKELKDVKEKEAQAIEQLRVLDAEELKLQQELTRLRNVEITQRERIVVLEAQLSEQGEQVDNELINIRSELAISKESEIKNKQTIAELESKLDKSESTISTLQSEIEKFNSKENETLVKLRKELSDTKLEIESQNELFSELGNQLTTTEKERDQYSERANELSRIIEQQKEEIKTFELTITNLKNELNDTKNISQTYQDEMKSLGEKLSNLETQLNDTKTSNEEYVQKINDLNSTLKTSNEEHVQKINDLNSTLRTSNEEHVQKINDLNSTLKTSNEEHVQKINDLNSTLRTSNEEHVQKINDLNSTLKTSNEEHVQKINDLNSTLNESNIQLTEKQELILIKDTQIKELEVTIENIKEELADAELSKNSESDHVKSLRNKIAEVEAKLEQSPSPSDLESAQQYATKQIELVKELESKIDEINKTNLSEVSNMNENINNLTKELNETRSAEEAQNTLINELESELKMKEDKIVELKEMLDNVNVQLSEKNEHLSVKENLEQEVQKLQKELDSMAKELTDASTKYKDAEVLLKDYKVQISKLEVALEDANKSSSDDKQKIDETSEISPKDTMTQDNHFVKSLQEKITELERTTSDSSNPTNYEIEVEELKQKISKLEEMNEEKSKSIESLKENVAEINESRQKIEKLQEEKNDLVKEIETLKSELEVKTIQYDQLETSVQKEKKEIEIILAEERRDKKNVEAAYANLESQIEELQVTRRSKFMCF